MTIRSKLVLALQLAALLMLLTTSCAQEVGPEVDEVDGTEAALVGVTANNGHTNVGQYCGPDACCTATMIAPRYFLTAAHCLGYKSRSTGGSLTLTAAAGAPTQTVAQAFAFGGDPTLWISRGCPGSGHSYCAIGAGEDDVALGQLTADMPGFTAGWGPAQFAESEVQNGDQVKTFGYGCNNRMTPNTPGPRGFFQWNWGTATQALCAGDSGGPVFRNSDNKIVRVNSGFDGAGNDLFGNPLLHRARIEQMIRQLEGGLEPGQDRPGMDLPGMPVNTATAAGCYKLCQLNPGCRAMNWASNGGSCWLKSGVPAPATNVNAVAGVMDSAFNGMMVATDMPGSDTRHPILTSQFACEVECAKDSSCKAATFVKNTGACWIKFAVPAANTTNGCATSGNCVSFVKKNRDTHDHFGGDYTNYGSGGEDLCAADCIFDQRCRGYAFLPSGSSGGTCYLKEPLPGSTGGTANSGTRSGMIYNAVIEATPMATFAMGTNPRPETCQSKCSVTTGCKAWSMKTVMSDSVNSCLLFSSYLTPNTTVFGAITGYRDLEYL